MKYLILVMILTLVAISCKEEKDKWGVQSKESYVRSKMGNETLDKMTTFHNEGKSATEEWCECVYDTQTKYLEEKYDDNEIKKGVNYRKEISDFRMIDIFVYCEKDVFGNNDYFNSLLDK